MKLTLKSKRILLEDAPALGVQEMMTALKEESSHLKLSPSKMVSWIVQYFKENSFEKVKHEMIQSHFNQKAYLREVIDGIGQGEDAVEKLQITLAQFRKSAVKKESSKRTIEGKGAHIQSDTPFGATGQAKLQNSVDKASFGLIANYKDDNAKS